MDEIPENVGEAEQQSSDDEKDESASIKSTESAAIKDESESESEEETDSESQDENHETMEKFTNTGHSATKSERAVVAID